MNGLGSTVSYNLVLRIVIDKARIGQGILIHVCNFSDNEAITHLTDLATIGSHPMSDASKRRC